jgi:hypothetical protein
VPAKIVEAGRVTAFSVAAAIVYGIIHDMITAHVCVEYFTIAHPLLLPTENPILLAMAWGVVATWWVGFLLGLSLSLAALVGPRPLALRDLRPSIIWLMITAFLVAIAGGIVGAALGMLSQFPLTEPWNALLPREKWVPFAFDAWAHLASYLAAYMGGLLVVAMTVIRRRKPIA